MEKIKKLKQAFDREKIDGYIIPKNDQFFGEYIPNHNDRLKFISNFTGSYGFSLILRSENYLFVDGRYTLQANNQSGKFFKIITFPNKMPNDILKNKTQQLVSKFNIKQSRLTIPNLRCQFDFRRKNDISNLDSFFQILEKL